MLQKVSYKEQIYKYLKEAIIKGDLKPGEIYSEQQFADKLNVSRTPVREAVLQLKSEDLVEIYNNRGLGIKALTENDLKQIIQARIAIESYGVRSLAKHYQEEAAQAIIQALNRCQVESYALTQDEAHHYEFMKKDMEFHLLILNYTQNPYLIRWYEQLRVHVERATIHSLLSVKRNARAYAEHQQILEAIAKGHVEKAGEALKYHMQQTAKVLEISESGAN